jgi:UDP-glucose 4-epimerase
MDLAEGHLAALHQLESLSGYDFFNLGTGNGTSVFQIVDIFQKESGMEIPYQITDRRLGDIAAYYSKPDKANINLNWMAKRGLNQMCASAWNWEKCRKNNLYLTLNRKFKIDYHK